MAYIELVDRMAGDTDNAASEAPELKEDNSSLIYKHFFQVH